MPWSPLKNGFLSGKYRRDSAAVDSARAAFVGGGPSESDFDVIEAVAGIADELETSSAAVALAWLRARPGTVVPIIGARRMEHLESNVEALGVELTSEQLKLLDEVSAPVLSYPAEVNGEVRASLQFAGTTVDGETSTVFPALLAGDARY